MLHPIRASHRPLLRVLSSHLSSLLQTRPLHMSYSNPPRASVHLILDWDGTLTKKDTTDVLVKISWLNQDVLQQQGKNSFRKSPKDSAPQLFPEDRNAQWDRIANTYIDDYAAHADAYRPAKHERTTIEEESLWLASLRKVEEESVARVEKAEIFAGFTHEAVAARTKEVMAAGVIELRDGWRGLFETCMRDPNSKVEVLSVNWSDYFIKCALQVAASESTRASRFGAPLREYIEKTPITANHIIFRSGRLTNRFRSRMRTSADKLGEMPLPLKKGGRRLVVYVGDSPTDFDALLAADIGICVRDKPLSSSQKELADTFERVGVDTRHIRYWKERQKQRLNERPNNVLWTRDLRELVPLLEATVV